MEIFKLIPKSIIYSSLSLILLVVISVFTFDINLMILFYIWIILFGIWIIILYINKDKEKEVKINLGAWIMWGIVLPVSIFIVWIFAPGTEPEGIVIIGFFLIMGYAFILSLIFIVLKLLGYKIKFR